MKHTMYSVIVPALLVVGCGRDPAGTPSVGRPAQRPAGEASTECDMEAKEVTWNPSLLEGGYMFQDAKEFHGYVRRAEIVATGVLSEWDGTKGKVQVESVFHGKLSDRSVPVLSTGSIARPKVGDKVLFLLTYREGQLKLHSFCGASGLYKYSDDLASVIKKSIKPTG